MCTLAADRRSNTNVYCINVALVFEYGTMITYCIKHCDKLSLDLVRNLFKQMKDVGHVARGYFMLLYSSQRSTICFSEYIYEYNIFLDHRKNSVESILTSVYIDKYLHLRSIIPSIS